MKKADSGMDKASDSTVKRITEMEERFDRASAVIAALEKALEDYSAAADDLKKLESYFDSGSWKKDFEADEKGKLPDGLKRGVLSEDGLWDLLSTRRELHELMKKLAADKQ
ncbi:MAG: DUF4298 domain-containing protein [Ruminococcus sp.]|nr:DUF4298 domain-containing protein [Ruminococcus sp.]